MSQQAYDRYQYDVDDVPQRGAIASVTHWAGALVSVGLVVSMAFWGYKLTMRDISEVPVVRAIEGPTRVQPDDPGGETAAHQGLAVNGVQASGGVEKTADMVILAPDPVDLAAEDTTSGASRPKSRELALTEEITSPTDVIAEDGNGNATEVLDESAINDAVTEAIKAAELDTGLAQLPGVKRSPRPKARAAMAAIAPTTLSDTDQTATKLAGVTVDIDPAEVTEGTRMVQLGAFDDRETAIREWDHIIERHGDLIGEHKRLIQQAESGGRSFYRLRMVGFADLGDSRRLCSALLARGTPCIPVTAR